jgi:hypothetical protein
MAWNHIRQGWTFLILPGRNQGGGKPREQRFSPSQSILGQSKIKVNLFTQSRLINFVLLKMKEIKVIAI